MTWVAHDAACLDVVFEGTKYPTEYELDVDLKAEIKYDSSQTCLN